MKSVAIRNSEANFTSKSCLGFCLFGAGHLKRFLIGCIGRVQYPVYSIEHSTGRILYA